MTDEERRSPLHDAQLAAGAEIIWEDGWPWAMTVGDTAQNEYEAIRTATGLWDLYSTIKYEVTGPDAGRLIQRRFTNDLSGVGAGQVRYGAFVNADGLMVDDGNVYKHADDKYWVMINTAGLEDWFRETADGLDARIERPHRAAADDLGHRSDVARPGAGTRPTSTCRRSGTSGSTPSPCRSPACRPRSCGPGSPASSGSSS